MAVRVPHVTAVTVLGHYKLRLSFDDGLTGDVDVSDLQDAGPIFEPLRDPECFARAYVDPTGKTVAWPGDIDLDPEPLHDEASRNQVATKRWKRHSPLASAHKTLTLHR
jgi:hypothetical protein